MTKPEITEEQWTQIDEIIQASIEHENPYHGGATRIFVLGELLKLFPASEGYSLIYGSSDDLIYSDGAVRVEHDFFGAKGVLIEFGDTIMSCTFTDEGNWTFAPKVGEAQLLLTPDQFPRKCGGQPVMYTEIWLIQS